MRFLIKFSYDGTNYNGFQKQPGLNTIEEEIEKALNADKDRTLEIIGDGMYTRIAPEGVRFINVPHLALSGRMYQNNKWKE